MNTKVLSKMYGTLSVRERISLRVAAEARDDDVEANRLLGPVRTMHFPEPLWPELALHMLALVYVAEQLDAAAGFFFARWQADGGEHVDDWLKAADANASFFTANAEAWRRFCAELTIDPEGLTRTNYAGHILSLCEQHMPGEAPSMDAMRHLLRDRGSDESLITAESLYENWRDLLNTMSGRPTPRSEREPL